MLILFSVILCITTLPFIRISSRNKETYLSRDTTDAIRGFFLIFVFIRHFLQYSPVFSPAVGDSLVYTLNHLLGQLIVAMFLFYSGYGVFESARRKGSAYLDTFLQRRVFRTWLAFAVSVCIYAVVTISLGFYPFEIRRFLYALIGWSQYGNSNWYIFCILILYLITWVSLRIFGYSARAVGLIFLLSCGYIAVISFFKESYFYNTCFCYVLGCFWSYQKKNLESKLDRYALPALLLTLVLFLISGGAYFSGPAMLRDLSYLVCGVFFAALIVQLTRFVHLQSRILMTAGKHLFPLYIFQRLPMIVLQDALRERGYLYFIVCMVATILLAWVYSRVESVIERSLRKHSSH